MNGLIKSILFSLTLLLFSSVKATNYYVNNNSTLGDVFTSAVGNNVNTGLTSALPKATVSNVLTTYGAGMVLGDSIIVDAGTFYQTDRNLLLPAGVVLIGAGMDLTIFDNNQDGATGYYFARLSSNVTVKNICITRYGIDNTYAQAIDVIAGALNVNIINVQIDRCGRTTGLYPIEIHLGAQVIINGGGATCDNSMIMSGGIHVEGVTTDVVIRNYLFINGERGENGTALRVTDGTVKVYNSKFENNIVSNGGESIVYQIAGTLKFYDCTFDNNSYEYTTNEYGGLILIQGGIFGITRSRLEYTLHTSSSYAYGAAITLQNGGTAQVDSCYFDGNDGSRGNDIHVRGGTATLTAFNCTFASASNQVGTSSSGTITLADCGNPGVYVNTGSTTKTNTNAPTYVAAPTGPSYSGVCGAIVISGPCSAPTDAGTNGTITVCSNGPSVNLFSSLVGTPDATGSWTGTSALTGGNLGSYNPSTMTPGVYTYTVVGVAPCSDATATVTVTETVAADAGTASALDATLCSGTSTTVSSTVAGGTWTSSNPLVATVDPLTGVVNALLGGTSTMTYTVLGTAGCLGSDATSTVLITVTQAADAGTASALDATLCSGTSTTVSSTVAGGTWTSSNPLVATVDSSTGAVNALLGGTSTMTYTVLGTAGCLGSDATSTVLITVTQAADAGTALDLDLTLCVGTSTTVSSTIAGGTWSSSNSLVATVDVSTGVVNALTAGTSTWMTYTVLGTDGCLGSDATATVDITVISALAPVIATVIQPDCSVSTGSVDLTGLPSTGAWTVTVSPGGSTINGTAGITTATFEGLLESGTYTFTVTNSSNCTSVASAPVVIDAQPIIPPAPVGSFNQDFCSALAQTIGDINVTGTSIQWYDAATAGTLLNSSDLLIDGAHYYATQTVGLCESVTSLDVVVHLDSLQLNLISTVTPTCNVTNGSISVQALNGMGDYSYTWSTGATSTFLSGIGEGTYTVIVTDSLLCSDELIITIDCKTNLIPEIITANGNGKNDAWVLNLAPNVSVQIFNRWGSLIYSALPYLDDWNGQSNEGVSLGNEFLPSGTYFYIIDYKDGSKAISGYIELIR